MAYINGRKILTCIYNGQVIPIVLKIGEGDGEEEGGASLSTLAEVGKYSLFELAGKTLGEFK